METASRNLAYSFESVMAEINETKLKKMDFASTEAVFGKTSSLELWKAYVLFAMMAKPTLVSVAKSLIRFCLTFHLPINKLLELTIFKRFCGGTSLENALYSVDQLWQSRIGSILDLSVEGEESEAGRDATVLQIIEGIKFSAKITPKVPMYAVKPSGVFDVEILQKIQAKQPLTAVEEDSYNRGFARLEAIAVAASDANIPISIDAEQSWIQNPIDEICLHLMRKYNKERPIVGTTLQMYRRDRLAFFADLIEKTIKEGFILAFKVVRGAYMESERERAILMGYESPIYPTKEDTDRAFNQALELSVDNLDQIYFWAATHNEKSTAFLLYLMAQNHIEPDCERIAFAQLKGMSDNISYNLASAGYKVAKYVPYGQVQHVIPYLFRRADENTAVAEQPARELEFIKQEMRRRKSFE